ncbi:ABC transporter permease [Blastopirellula marina]|uniref:ABC transporter permease protein n=1 Tax=Blastopirellula marina DSM 3645 TaxID=314230 RepID=A3ZPE5_9BACT|nr:ABC transporter permease [Blastopirellula marina]EAQ81623.1 ABC transporter permease protein [Blastopirellula marina DSM 3645]
MHKALDISATRDDNAASDDSNHESSPIPLEWTTYTPATPLRRPLRLLSQIFGDLWKNRELTWILFQRDLKAQFRQSFLGYVWLIIPPLGSALVWYLLNAQKVLNVDTGEVPYAAFVLVGTTLWAAFSATVMAPISTITANREVLVKLNVCLEAFILAGFARVLFNLAVTVAVLFLTLIAMRVGLHWTAIFFPLSAFAFLTIAFAVGMCISPLGALYSDIQNALSPFLAIVMFTAPVVFPLPEASGQSTGVLATLMAYNPLTPAIALSRDNLFSGSWNWFWLTLIWVGISGLVLLSSFVALRVAKPHIIARMGM